MPLTLSRKAELDALCRQFRIDVLRMLHTAGSGHAGGSLSVCEILTALYFEKATHRASDPQWQERDRIVLSKGHAAPMLYRILAERGFVDKAELYTLRRLGSCLQGHPCAASLPGVELTSGPLGIGLSAALGMALGLRLSGNVKSTVYVVMGDGELNEGTVWEACMCAVKFQARSLVIVVDQNGVQLDGSTKAIMPMGDLGAKFAAFGLHVFSCDGHDVSALCDALEDAKAADGPAVILAKTVKGKGVSFMEGQSIWHGKSIDDAELEQALGELRGGLGCE